VLLDRKLLPAGEPLELQGVEGCVTQSAERLAPAPGNLHQGLCSKCGGRGPADVHTKDEVWSALVLTQLVQQA